MPCRDLQTKLALHDPLTPEETRHAAICPDCADFAAFDDDLALRLADWRDPRVLPVRRRAPARTRRVALAGAGLAAALVLGALALPARSTAETARAAYRQMLQGVRRVRTLHLVVRWRPRNGRVEDGPLRPVEELWWRPGAWREARPGALPSLKLADRQGVKFYRYDPAQGEVSEAIETLPQTEYRSFDLAKFAETYMATPTRFEQPTAAIIVATNAGGWSRMIFTLDPTTGLPTHAEKQSRPFGGEWSVSGELDLEFDRPMPDAWFTPESLKP